jgi:hypothetical protein
MYFVYFLLYSLYSLKWSAMLVILFKVWSVSNCWWMSDRTKFLQQFGRLTHCELAPIQMLKGHLGHNYNTCFRANTWNIHGSHIPRTFNFQINISLNRNNASKVGHKWNILHRDNFSHQKTPWRATNRSHRNLSTRASMLALVQQTFLAKNLVKCLLTSTLDKEIWFYVDLSPADPRATHGHWTGNLLQRNIFTGLNETSLGKTK